MLYHHHSVTSSVARVISLFLLLVLLAPLLTMTEPAGATGSRNMLADGTNGQGFRAFLEWHETASSAGIPRQTTIKAYATAGETIYIGSSGINFLQGDVVFRSPDGRLTGRCTDRDEGNPLVGRIENLAQEQAGPRTTPTGAGYRPCVITPQETTDSGPGIWEFDFISPNPRADFTRANPVPLRVNQEWSGRIADQVNHWIAAWDVSVRDTDTAAGGTGDVEIPGRVFTNYLALNMGSNATSTNPNLGLFADFYILTYDGYGYEVDMNGIDPFGFVFFANAEGIVDSRGNPIYRSIQLVGTNATQALPTAPDGTLLYRVHNPRQGDTIATGDITHKIFFDLTGPAPDMPAEAPSASGQTWLLPPQPRQPPVPGNPTFVGEEGTPGQAGTNPLGGFFTFDAPEGLTYNVVIDVNRDGQYGNANDRTIIGRTGGTRTSAYWNGLDGLQQRVPAGPLSYSAIIELFVGEVHFPFIDAENHLNGHRLRRVRDAGLPLSPRRDPWQIHYDDSYTYTPGNPYDYSLCAFADRTNPPPTNIVIQPAACYGSPGDARREARSGVSSQEGAHRWNNRPASLGFGDRRLIDTWTYYPSDPIPLSGNLVLAESDLSITKSHSPASLVPGGPVTYTVVVRNGGPSPAVGARVRDNVPAPIVGVTWNCAVTTGVGRCSQDSGTGNRIDTTVDLDPGAELTYTIQGTLDPDAEGSLANTATVGRPNDNTDPNLDNNTDTNIASITPVADLELTKTLLTPPPLRVNSEIEFSLTLRNRGPSRANTITVTDPPVPGLTFVSATPSQGTFDGASGLWTVGSLARNGVATVTIRATWNGTPTTNTAEVTSSDRFDPDSTPNNNIPTEDDQSSAQIPGAVADLELSKVVNTPRVNVGRNAVFTIELFNRGPDQATNVSVSDRLPVGLAFVGATPSQGTYNPVNGAWEVGTLDPGTRASLAIEVTVLNPGPFTNSAQVSASDQYDPDSTPNNDVATEDDQDFATLAGDLADLALSKRVNTPQPNLGEVITFTVELRNDGPSTATGVAVTDRLPAGLGFVDATPGQGTYDPATGIWTVGTVRVGTRITLSLRATVQSSDRLVNTAEVTSSDQPDPDSTPNNNNPNEDDQASAALTPQIADLELAKRVDSTRPVLGGPVTFTIDLFNRGPFPATGVQVRDDFPAGLTYTGHTAERGSYNPTTGFWDVGPVAVDETLTLTITAIMDGLGPFTNVAEVSKADQFDPDSTPGNNNPGEDDQGSATVSSPIADLSVSKGADSFRIDDGGAVYIISVNNAGPDPATGVRLAEQLPPGATLITATPGKGTYANGEWIVGDLAVGETAFLTINVTLSGATSYTNIVQVSASDQPDPDSTPGNNNPNEDDYASLTLPSGPIDLELDQQPVVALTKIENGALLTIDLVNRGPVTATGVAVENKLPPELRFIEAVPSKGDYNPATSTWTVGTLAPDERARLQIVVQIISPETPEIINMAQVSRANEFDIDSTPNNNNPAEDDQDQVPIRPATAVTLKRLTATAELTGVRVAWETGLELNTAGFYLYRSADGSRATATRITAGLVAARGTGVGGASYSHLDTSANAGTSYTYWLVEVERGGATNEYGPVTVSGGTNKVFLPMLR